MPYIITTHDAELLYGGRTTDTRRAVATLDEARETALDTIWQTSAAAVIESTVDAAQEA